MFYYMSMAYYKLYCNETVEAFEIYIFAVYNHYEIFLIDVEYIETFTL